MHVGKIVPIQLSLNLPQKPNPGLWRRRIRSAKTIPELRALAEQLIDDYQAEVDRLDARRTAALVRAEALAHGAGEMLGLLHD